MPGGDRTGDAGTTDPVAAREGGSNGESMSEQSKRTTDLADSPAPSTRRRTLLALAGIALGAAGHGYVIERGDQPTTVESGVSASHVATASAVAEAVYPSTIAVTQEFIEQRVFGRVEPRPGHFEGVTAAIEAIEVHTRARFGGPITALPPADRRQVLRSMGVTSVHPIPDGTTPERVRFYLVNDLLFALFTSPASTTLTGIENPPGHPGGRDAYRHGPDGGVPDTVWNRPRAHDRSTSRGEVSDD